MAASGSLTSVDLSWNELGSAGAEVLAPAIARSSSLTHLNLPGNRICDEGAKHLAEAIRASSSLAEGYELDGKDLTPVFTGANDTTPHQCVFLYQGSPSTIDAANMTYENDWGSDVLFAMRCGDLKVSILQQRHLAGVLMFGPTLNIVLTLSQNF